MSQHPQLVKTIDIAGWISLRDYGESSNVVNVSDDERPLAERLIDEISDYDRDDNFRVEKQLSVKYWICDKEASKDEAISEVLKRLDGSAEIEFCARYSDLTGYLWTDEQLNVGGHDLLREIASSEKKWLILEIDVFGDGE